MEDTKTTSRERSEFSPQCASHRVRQGASLRITLQASAGAEHA